MTPIEVRLTQGKETKSTYRFEAEGPQAPITRHYVRKTAPLGSVAKAVRLTVADG